MPELDWVTCRPATPMVPNYGFVLLPVFDLSGITWLGSSSIVRQFNYSASRNFVLRRRPTKPADANYLLCIRHRIDDDVFRYKLWDDEDAAVDAPLYTGQVVKKNFALEIWNLNGETTAVQAEELEISLSIREAITDYTVEPEEFEDDDSPETVTLADLSVTSLPFPAAVDLTPALSTTPSLFVDSGASVVDFPAGEYVIKYVQGAWRDDTLARWVLEDRDFTNNRFFVIIHSGGATTLNGTFQQDAINRASQDEVERDFLGKGMAFRHTGGSIAMAINAVIGFSITNGSPNPTFRIEPAFNLPLAFGGDSAVANNQ